MKSNNRQFAILDSNGAIAAIILTRGNEFYCFEQLDDAPSNFKKAMEHYPEGKLVELDLSVKAAKANSGLVTGNR
ncbi:MAG TPA: hypothetical protein VEJ63_14925 [Planctomycetota bacterium]|nr:hypothetical protein [Planctomycetota bacterium]